MHFETFGPDRQKAKKKKRYVMRHVSDIKCHMLGAMCQESDVRCNISRVACPLSPATKPKSPVMNSRLVCKDQKTREKRFHSKKLSKLLKFKII